MKTLYIPTTTLNFNNIMSSESISPKAFYMQREFGYKNWHNIVENPFDNSILLYEEIPLIIRPKSDYDDYPMIIAVCLSEEQFEDMSFTKVPGVWQYDKTIYLTPSSTTIFFDTEEHKRIALSKSESSAETKMVALYRPRMYCAQMEKQYNISSCKDIALNLKEISKDQRINKMKGFLYGYYVGAAMSMYENDVLQLNIINEIKNIFAAILASLDGKATKEQWLQLNELFRRLKQFEPLHTHLKKIIESNNMSTEEKIDSIISAINDSKYDNYYSCSFQYLLNEIQKGKPEHGDNPAISWVNKTIKNHIENARLHKILLRPESGEIQLSSLSLISIKTHNVKTGKPQELFKAVINDVLATNKYNGKISTFKMDLATEITYKAKDVFAEEWNDSCQAKVYLNALRKHIGGEPFNQQWNAGVLGSIASVVLKGDDWEKLLEFLQSKGIADYRLAFAIYGTLNGFANITRDFSNIILKEEKEYVNAVYQFFHKQLHETDVHFSDVPYYKQALENVNRQENTSLNKKNTTPNNTINNEKTWLENTIDSFKNFIGVNPSDKELPECLITIFNSEHFGRIKPQGQNWYKDEALKLWKEYKTNSLEFQKSLLYLKDKCLISGTKGQWEKCIKLIAQSKSLKPSNKSSRKSKNQEVTLFSSNEDESYVTDDFRNIHFIRSLHVVKSFNEAQIKRLIHNWDFTQRDYANDPVGHLNYFIRLCKKESRGGLIKYKDLINAFPDDIAKKFIEEIQDKWKKGVK